MAQQTYPFGPVLDDSGVKVTGATVTIASVTTAAGAAISSHGATVLQAGAFVSVLYDAELKGDAVVTLAVSKAATSITKLNAAPVQYLTKDSQRLGQLTFVPTTNEIHAKLYEAGVAVVPDVDLPADTADAVWAVATRTITGGTVTTYTGNSPQTGDAFARIGALGAGLTSLASATSMATVAGYIDTEITAIKLVADHLATALELDGSVYRFTVNALEQAPAGGGGGGSVTVAGYAVGQDPATLLATTVANVASILDSILSSQDAAAVTAGGTSTITVSGVASELRPNLVGKWCYIRTQAGVYKDRQKITGRTAASATDVLAFATAFATAVTTTDTAVIM